MISWKVECYDKPQGNHKKTTRRSKNNDKESGTREHESIANIIERISDGFVAFDAQMKYTYANERSGQLLGPKPEDLIGRNYWKEFPEAKGTPCADACVHALVSFNGFLDVIRQIESYWISLNVAPPEGDVS